MVRKLDRVDATKGSLFKLIIIYSVPLICSSLIQNMFNAVDLVVLGNMADSTAVASVGATTAIIHLLVNGFIGIAGGTRIILAHQIGAKDKEGTKRSIDTSIIMALFIGILVAVVGIVFAPFFLRVTNCPKDCFDGAVIYIRIYTAAAPAILLYNFGSAILNASGDTKRPLYYIIASGFLNAILNVILCLVLPIKVVAVAVATASSQILGAILVFKRLCNEDLEEKVEPLHMQWNWSSCGKVLRQGVPLMLTNMLYPFANLQIQSAVNSFGVSATAGSSVCTTIDGFVNSFTNPFATTVTTFMGQNIGAKQPKRVKRSLWYCLILAVVMGFGLGWSVYLTGRFWIRLIVPGDPAAVEFGLIKMFYVTSFYGVQGANAVLGHSIQTYGYPIFSTVNSVFFVLCFRMIWMTFVFPYFKTFECLMACFTVSWLLMAVVNVFGSLFFGIRYNKGKYKNI